MIWRHQQFTVYGFDPFILSNENICLCLSLFRNDPVKHCNGQSRLRQSFFCLLNKLLPCTNLQRTIENYSRERVSLTVTALRSSVSLFSFLSDPSQLFFLRMIVFLLPPLLSQLSFLPFTVLISISFFFVCSMSSL